VVPIAKSPAHQKHLDKVVPTAKSWAHQRYLDKRAGRVQQHGGLYIDGASIAHS